MSISSINSNSQTSTLKFDKVNIKDGNSKPSPLEENLIKTTKPAATNKHTSLIKTIWSNISNLLQWIGEKLRLVRPRDRKIKALLAKGNEKSGEHIFEIKEIPSPRNRMKKEPLHNCGTFGCGAFVSSNQHPKDTIDHSHDSSSHDGSHGHDGSHSCGSHSCGSHGCGSHGCGAGCGAGCGSG